MSNAESLHALQRRRYLDAMGITSYVSRGPLPGAAPTQRLAVVRQPAPGGVTPRHEAEQTRRAPTAPPAASPLKDLLQQPATASVTAQPAQATAAVARQGSRVAAPRFSLSIIFSGNIAWMEDLQGRPLATEQLQLVHAMARALGPVGSAPEALQFDWPPHNNQQLDIGPEGASAALSGFLGRQLEQRQCRGVVLLGDGHLTHVPEALFSGMTLVRTDSTATMLEQPQRKRQVWLDLQALVSRS